VVTHFIFLCRFDPIPGHGDHTHWAHHSRYDSSGRVIGPTQRPLPDNTQQTNIHVPGGIRTRNPSTRAAANPRLRPRDHRDRQWLHSSQILNLFNALLSFTPISEEINELQKSSSPHVIPTSVSLSLSRSL
jgi:hypothetical protein